MTKLDLRILDSLQDLKLFEEGANAVFDNMITLTDEQG